MSGAYPALIFPSLGTIWKALIKAFTKDSVMTMVSYSLSLIIRGLLCGIVLAVIFSSLSVVSSPFYQIYNMLVSLFDLIPGVALIPLAILWLGIGEKAIIFIVVHSVIWPMSRSLISGFQTVPSLYIEVGKNLGLSKIQLVTGVYMPAALPAWIAGLRTGWARAWRGLISSEMVFGTTSAGAGIGWYIMTKRMNVDVAGVFAAIIIIICIGAVIEYLGFRTLEKLTVKKWGMSR